MSSGFFVYKLTLRIGKLARWDRLDTGEVRGDWIVGCWLSRDCAPVCNESERERDRERER